MVVIPLVFKGLEGPDGRPTVLLYGYEPGFKV